MIDKTILPDFIIADIYKNHLVEMPLDSKIISTAATVKDGNSKNDVNHGIAFLGNNQKHVTVLMNEANAAFINDKELAFLSKILSACNLTIADIAIVNTSNTDVEFGNLQTQLKPARLLLFNVDPTTIKLPFTMPEFQVQNFANCTILCSPSLSEMLDNSAASKALKIKLWTALQKAFNLN